MRTLALLSLLVPLASTFAADPAPTPPADPIILRLPDAALVPDVAVDPKGVVHVVYGLGDHAWYIRSTDDGANFTPPVQVNAAGKVQLTMGERGPKLALGPDGTLHIVYVDRWSPGARCFVRYTRSTDAGRHFEPSKQISSMPGVDGATLAADPDGNVLVFWHVFLPPHKEAESAHWMYLARSTDHGQTFAPEQRVHIDNMKDLACSMCMMRARIAPDRNVYLAFRAAENNIRDFYVLRSPVAENRFTPLRVNRDNWQIPTCPMNGPELTLDPAGRPLCAFMSRNRVYWSRLDAAAQPFALHIPTPSPEHDEIYPTAVADRAGHILLTWQVGPMAVGKKATVKWALYNPDGTPTGQHGTLGASTSGTKPTAFLGADGRFRILTTARP